jgi:predicted ArsR family transcriptional regulator
MAPLVQCVPSREVLVPDMTAILECLKKHGQRLDSELAEETGLPIAKVRQRLAELAATGAIITCSPHHVSSRQAVDGLVCRMSGWFRLRTRSQDKVPA